MPNIPVEALIETGRRTAMSYLIKPFADQIDCDVSSSRAAKCRNGLEPAPGCRCP
jgi:hypothetical protein